MKIKTITISVFILLFCTTLISARIEFKIDEQPIQIWRVISGLGEVEKLKETVHFRENETYILLNTYKSINTKYKLSNSIHYWLGKNTSVETRIETAGILTILWEMLILQSKIVVFISREVQYEESEYFESRFHIWIPLNRINQKTSIPELYEIEEKRNGKKRVNDVVIKLISLNMIQLNDKKGYVLDTGNNIYVYKGSKISSSEVRNIIDQLADVIYSDNCLINGENKSKIYNKEKEFLHKLSEVTGKKVSWKGTSAFLNLLEKFSGEKSSKELLNNEPVKLPKLLSVVSNNDYRQLINASYYDDDNLLNDRHVCSFILQNETVHYLYIGIGILCNMKDNKYILQEGEKLAHKSEQWKKVIFVTDYIQSAVFSANFHNFRNQIESYSKTALKNNKGDFS